jgi:hypothetical protein
MQVGIMTGMSGSLSTVSTWVSEVSFVTSKVESPIHSFLQNPPIGPPSHTHTHTHTRRPQMQLLSASAVTGHRAYAYGFASVVCTAVAGLLIYGIPVWAD